MQDTPMMYFPIYRYEEEFLSPVAEITNRQLRYLLCKIPSAWLRPFISLTAKKMVLCYRTPCRNSAIQGCAEGGGPNHMAWSFVEPFGGGHIIMMWFKWVKSDV